MLKGHKLAFVRKSLKWLDNKFLTFAHIFEYLRAEQEIAAIDSKISALPPFHAVDSARVVHIDDMVSQGRTDCQKASKFATPAEDIKHLVEIGVAKAVA